MAKDVKFNIKLTIDGKQHIVKASTNVKKFAEELALAQTSSNKLRDQLIKFNGIATSFQNLAAGLQQLTGVAQTYINANKVQVEAETKLETVMRQRMNATEEEIQSIKDLASAQQALGVIGDEVQLMGIQQVSTFLQEKSSLDALIPAMNNLLAQQKGLNATGQDAVNIGNMVGKVMQGQIGALTRAGITFTEAQAEVIKLGTESERAAMLAQVITDNVGEMNAALAKTDAGKAKQAANDLGDLQEVWGSFIAKYEKSIVVFSQMTMAVSSSMYAFQGLKGVIVSFGSVFGGWTNAMRKTTASVKTFAAGLKTLATASTVAGTAMRSLLITTGVGAAVAAMSIILGKLNRELAKTSETTEALRRVQENAGKQYDEQAARIKTLTSAIRDESIATETRKKYIEELKKIIPEYNAQISEEGRLIGENKKAIDDYLVSFEKKVKFQAAEKELTDLYERQRKEENRLAEAEKARDKAEKAARRAGQNANNLSRGMDIGVSVAQNELGKAEKEIRRAKEALDELDDAIEKVGKERSIRLEGIKADKVITPSASSAGSLKTAYKGKDDEGGGYLEAQNSLQDYDKAIAYHKKVQQTATQEEYRDIQRIIDALEERRAAFIGTPEKIVSAPEEAPAYRPAPVEELNTIGKLTDAIRHYQEVQQNQTEEEIVNTQRTINQLEAKLKAMQQLLSLPTIEADTERLQGLEPEKLQIELELIGLDGVRERLKGLQSMLSTAPSGQRSELEELIPVWEKYEKRLDVSQQRNVSAQEVFGALSSSMSRLGSAVGDGAGEWLNWSANLLGAIGTAIPAIMALTVTKKAEANANTEAAVTGAAASVSSIPFVGAFMAVAAIASVIAALANIPKFAKGGIAYGPTLGIFGEYAGASNNPEVIAPLDKLRGMLSDTGNTQFNGRVEFKIKGRTLIGILDRENNITRRS